jgi:hypothetical protein
MHNRFVRAADLDEPTLYSVYVGNLPYAVDSDELLRLVSRYGEPSFCQVVRSSNGASRGFGFVSFHDVSTSHEVMDHLQGKMFGGREIIVRVGDVHVMLEWFSGSRIGQRIKSLIDNEHEKFQRGEKDTRPSPLPRRRSPPTRDFPPPPLPPPPPLIPPPPVRDSVRSEQAILAELVKRQFEVDAEQQIRAALQRKLEERAEQERAQDRDRERDRQLSEKWKELDSTERDLALALIEKLSSKKTVSRPPDRWESDIPSVPKPRRTPFFEDDPI